MYFFMEAMARMKGGPLLRKGSFWLRRDCFVRRGLFGSDGLLFVQMRYSGTLSVKKATIPFSPGTMVVRPY